MNELMYITPISRKFVPSVDRFISFSRFQKDCLETCERGISMTEIIKSESLRISKELDKIAEQNPK